LEYAEIREAFTMKMLEHQFNADMQNIYITAKKELGYNANSIFYNYYLKKGGFAKLPKSSYPKKVVPTGLRFFMGNIND
jgi:hypothetical protein